MSPSCGTLAFLQRSTKLGLPSCFSALVRYLITFLLSICLRFKYMILNSTDSLKHTTKVLLPTTYFTSLLKLSFHRQFSMLLFCGFQNSFSVTKTASKLLGICKFEAVYEQGLVATIIAKGDELY